MACMAGVAWCRGGATHCAVVAGAATPMASTCPPAALRWGGAGAAAAGDSARAAHSANHRMRPMRAVPVPTRQVHPRPQHLGARRCAAGASAAAAADAATTGDGSEAASGQGQHPHELPVRVYIEHTDTYQVVYNANYFKFLWRQGLTLVHFPAQPDPFLVTQVPAIFHFPAQPETLLSLKSPNAAHRKCSRPSKKWTHVAHKKRLC